MDDTFRAPCAAQHPPRHGCAAGQRGSGNHPQGRVTKTANLAHHPLRSIGRPEHQHVQVRRPRCQVWLPVHRQGCSPGARGEAGCYAEGREEGYAGDAPTRQRDLRGGTVGGDLAAVWLETKATAQRTRAGVPARYLPGGTPHSRGSREMRQPLMSSKSRAWPVVAMHQVRL